MKTIEEKIQKGDLVKLRPEAVRWKSNTAINMFGADPQYADRMCLYYLHSPPMIYLKSISSKPFRDDHWTYYFLHEGKIWTYSNVKPIEEVFYKPRGPNDKDWNKSW